jgi:hypothetical protein
LYAVGGAALSWLFSDGAVTFDCNALDPAGTMQVGLNFQDVNTGQWVYGALGDWHLCHTKPIVYSFLRPGTYKVSLYAKTASGAEYRNLSNMAPVTVQTHVFPGPNQSLQVTMYRQ